MNTHRVTLTAFGTTGVLLAASLTMLAIVSALVTFDAWPTRDRGASPAEIAIQNPRAARVVRAVRNAGATTDGSGVVDGVGGGSGGIDGAGGLPASGAGDGGGGGDAGNPIAGGHGGRNSPSPYVGPSPPGEGDPGGDPVPEPDPGLVGEVTTTACGAVGSVGGAVCGSGPEAYEDAVPVDVDPPAGVDVQVALP